VKAILLERKRSLLRAKSYHITAVNEKKEVLFRGLLSSFYGVSSLWFAFFRKPFSEHEISKMSYFRLIHKTDETLFLFMPLRAEIH